MCRDMSRITDRAFSHLSSLQTLHLWDVPDPYITSDIMEKLLNLRDFVVSDIQMQFHPNDGMFKHLSHLEVLELIRCTQVLGQITDRAFMDFPKTVANVRLWGLFETSLTDRAFGHMNGLAILKLNVSGCTQTAITNEAFRHLPKLTQLCIHRCTQSTLTPEVFQHLSLLRHLEASSTSGALSDRSFSHLSLLTHLDIAEAIHAQISDLGFSYLRALKHFNMARCTHTSVTDHAFRHIPALTYVNVEGCNQPTLSPTALVYLQQLQEINANASSLQGVTFPYSFCEGT
eukprot:gb/GECG01012482.1/.p1 GENE.gb/GECG01012482.1/~~gb/GECG01012482.1/.p1  ORF type:complete len:288 (+),score=17.83 gb/GECG01012482.1/:1-864(+)